MKHIPYEYRRIIANDALVLIVRDMRKDWNKGIYVQRKRLTKPTEFTRAVQKCYAQSGGKIYAVKYIKHTLKCSLREALDMTNFMIENGREPDGKV